MRVAAIGRENNRLTKVEDVGGKRGFKRGIQHGAVSNMNITAREKVQPTHGG